MQMQICIPRNQTRVLVRECCGGDWDAFEESDGLRADEMLASIARTAGLSVAREMDFDDDEMAFGAVWEGTEAQCKKARDSLPKWAVVSEHNG